MTLIDSFEGNDRLRSTRIVWSRLRSMEAQMKSQQQKWINRWKTQVMPTRIPGVWKRKEGGHLVRARVKDPTTGKIRELKKVLPEADEATAFKWLADERNRIRAGLVLVAPQKTRFAEYAASLFEKKLLMKHIKSARGRERWRITLEHLVGETKGVTAFGEFFLDQIRLAHVERWQMGIARLIAAGEYSPVTANGWIGILKVIFKAARRELRLTNIPVEEIETFDTAEHPTYTEEEPNTLLAPELHRFLTCMQSDCPQHYAFAYLGFVTGARPSHIRPLRRKGPTPDILWDEGVILIRRSHTLGDEVMETTKTGLRQRITVPQEVIDVLRWHVDTQLKTPEQQDSDLLFPREDGGFRTDSGFKKAFDVVGGLIGLKKKFTPRGMRRTFNDMCRAAKVESLVTKSISGHLTDRMKDHYSTVSPIEQRESIGRVLRLVNATGGGAPSGAPTCSSGAPDKERVA
jgi:integrase